jgi:hypothetical protein
LDAGLNKNLPTDSKFFVSSIRQTLEEFFKQSFNFMDRSRSEIREVRHFDGFTYWTLMLDESSAFLKIIADQNPAAIALPTLEIEIYYSEASIVQLTGGLTALVIVPLSDANASTISLTRTPEGRISFSTHHRRAHDPATI